MLELSKFTCDISPPVGAPLCGGTIAPAMVIDEPQYALGIVLRGEGAPIVLVTLDCLGVYNRAYDRFVNALADAAETSPKRVLITSVHQHDSPWHEPDVQRLIDEHELNYAFCDVAHFDRVMADTAAALREGLTRGRPVTHVGVGRAKVDRVASNRRILTSAGKVEKMRGSRCHDPVLRAAPEGLIDPYLTSLRFFDGDTPVATISHYATHPMSLYGDGRVSSDFCGLARARRQAAQPDGIELFANGCAGNIAAGKYNDGSPGVRDELTQKMFEAMVAAAANVKPRPIGKLQCRQVPMNLPVRNEPGFTEQDCRHALQQGVGLLKDYFDDAMRAGLLMTQDIRHSVVNLMWRKRAIDPIDVPVIDLGVAKLVLLPGEPFIEFQLAAQQMCTDAAVIVMGYGNGGPGYLCTDVAYDQGGYEPGLPAYTGRGAEAIVRETLGEALA